MEMNSTLSELCSALQDSFSLDTKDTDVVDRESEVNLIQSVLSKSLKASTGSALYVCGLPGTGKTLSVLKTALKIQATSKRCDVIYINCMRHKDARDIYVDIYHNLKKVKKSQINFSTGEIINQLEKTFFNAESKRMMFCILDEVDHMVSRTNKDLYRIFEWPFEEGSRFTLIGIANALDLIQKHLPRLSSCGREPKLLHMKPYTQDQIYIILKDRVEKVTTEDFVQDEALRYCAKLIEVKRGDIRKALDICRQVMARKQLEFQRHGKEDLEVDEYLLSLDDMMDMMDDVFGESNSPKIKSLPLHAQLIVISSQTASPTALNYLTFAAVYKEYLSNCSLVYLDPVNRNEFFDVLSSITSSGLMSLDTNEKVEENKRRITLVFNKDDVVFGLEHLKMLRPLLDQLESTNIGGEQ
ncbi:hypothetical protein SAMD00019534_014220 [Acytostelium subglobosum LB1]|uniref:hypothetical protein n=1 Tax=Acytostelium subglobosum LB1 TaxID=1410327 RepID=UPI0006450796|nr:hypothetical protein SAMD00019534_014220 [Acytostelium subglobosum LB1]GAM18247.1 hypothetical protein SAMD00019534_014220 [Acytostelium subglobosum LB1]|eukprot:XP_012758843.1 hypothetical protein SAMD00019534_014220 [Acytostelium subglobosum LB1]